MSHLTSGLVAGVAARLAAFGETVTIDPEGDGSPLLVRSAIVTREPLESEDLTPGVRAASALSRRATVFLANDATLGYTAINPVVGNVQFKWKSTDADNTTFRIVGDVRLEGGFFIFTVEA